MGRTRVRVGAGRIPFTIGFVGTSDATHGRGQAPDLI